MLFSHSFRRNSITFRFIRCVLHRARLHCAQIPHKNNKKRWQTIVRREQHTDIKYANKKTYTLTDKSQRRVDERERERENANQKKKNIKTPH